MALRSAGALLGLAVVHLVIVFGPEKYVMIAVVGVLVMNVGLWKMGSSATAGNAGWRAFAVLAVALALVLVAAPSLPPTILMTLPCAIYLVLFVLFGSTLAPGRVPLITQVHHARQRGGSTAADGYTRHLTRLWAVIFLLLALQSLWLLARSDLETWSWWINFVNPALIATLFLGEHALRPSRYGRATPLATLRAIVAMRLRVGRAKPAE